MTTSTEPTGPVAAAEQSTPSALLRRDLRAATAEQTPPQEPAPAKLTGKAPGPARKKRGRGGRLFLNILLQLGAMAAIGMLVYPDAASWVARISHNSEISGYVERVQATPGEERQRILDAAYAYNDQLEPGPLTDPYITMNEDEARRSDLYQAYEEMLRVSGTDAIGTLSYPGLNMGLPIYHGTADATISKGVGHMYGTSLPIGGPSTRSVMTAHSGLPHSALFTPLLQAKVGDTFWISVLGEDHHYRVESTEVVEPGQTDSLKIIEGEDWVTLFTCTPIGINSHRFMVHAVRIAGPDAVGREVIGGDGAELGFPWWALWFVLGSGAVAWVLFVPVKRRKKKAAAEPDVNTEPDGNSTPDVQNP